MEHLRTDPNRDQIHKNYLAGQEEGKRLLAMIDETQLPMLEVHVAQTFVKEREAGNVDFRMSRAQGMWNVVGSMPLSRTLAKYEAEQQGATA